MPLADWN